MNYIENISFSAIVQVAILYLVIYSILKAAKGSRFGQALMGVGILALMMIAFSYLFHFDVLSRIIQALLIYLAISSVVIFQPEIRRLLSQMGALGYIEKPKHMPNGSATPELVIDTIMSLSAEKVGALIAFERGISLRSYESTGVSINAIFSWELIRSILEPPQPLHDGGITIRDGRVSAAHCVFPVSNSPNLAKRGMRHRAAVGISEETDALVVVVSEETGTISVAHNGKLFRYTGDQTRQSLSRWVNKAMPPNRSHRFPVLKIFDRLTNGLHK